MELALVLNLDIIHKDTELGFISEIINAVKLDFVRNM